MNKILEFIKKLSNANGAPGFEGEVISVISDYMGDAYDLKEDTMRNLLIYSKKYNPKLKTLMLDGHSDEVAFMVQSIESNGMLKFLALGGWFSQNVGAHKVRIKNSEGDYITGIISSKPPHFMTSAEKGKIVEISEMRIDVGTTSYDETVSHFKIEPGAPIVPDVNFDYNEQTGMMLGKAFDNRLGCALVATTMKQLDEMDLKVNVVGAISSQEEIGTRGSIITSRAIKPDVALVFEGTPADDPYRGVYEAQGVVKGGVQIRHRDSSMIANPKYVKMIRDKAKEKNIKFQDAIRLGGGTDGGSIHLAEKAIPTVVLGVPVRYAHTHYGYAAMSDYEATLSLAVEFIRDFTEEKLLLL